jgi:hypothetical protein
LLLLQHHPKEKRLSWHYFSFHMRGGGSVGLVGHTFHVAFPAPPYFSHSHISGSCPCYHVLASGVCIISRSGLFNTCMLHNLTTQGEERNIWISPRYSA